MPSICRRIHMKKTLLMLAFSTFVTIGAGSLAFKAQNASIFSRPDDHDPELAATIRQMTNRSMAGLEKEGATGRAPARPSGAF